MIMTRRVTSSEIIERITNKHGNRYEYSNLTNIKLDDDLVIICEDHGRFIQKAYKHSNGRGCPECGKNKCKPKRISTEEWLDRFQKTHGNRYSYGETTFTESDKINIKCHVHGIFTQSKRKHGNGSNCPKCSKTKRLTHNEYMSSINTEFKSKYDYSEANIDDTYPYMIVICPGHGKFNPTVHNHLKKNNPSGCPKCHLESRIKTEQIYIDELSSQFRDYKIISAKVGRIKFQCKENHGTFEHNLSYFKQMGCPICNGRDGRSKGEKKISEILSQLGIEYEHQFYIKGESTHSNLAFDFYLPDLNIFIEYDGEQHFIQVEHWKGAQGLIERKSRDNFKSAYCKDVNSTLIRIKYDQFDCIEDILDYIISYHNH
jgi:hypothetical protein